MRNSYRFTIAFWLALCPTLTGQSPQIVSHHTAIFTQPPKLVPSTKVVDGPILGNGDVGVAIGGPPEDQQFFLGKNDLWSESLGSYVTVGGLAIDIPELAGSSYHQEQDISRAEVAGVFERDGVAVDMRSYVPANHNLLVTMLASRSTRPLGVTVRAWTGEVKRAALKPGPAGERDRLVLGQALNGRSPANGLIDEVQVYDRVLTGFPNLHRPRDFGWGHIRRIH